MSSFSEFFDKHFRLIVGLYLAFALIVVSLTVASKALAKRPARSGQRYLSLPADPNDISMSGSADGSSFSADGQSQSAKPVSSSATPSPSPSPQPKPDATPAAGSGDAGTGGQTQPLQYPLPDLKPLGSAGSDSVEVVDPATEEFIPMPDRWRLGWPRYDRYQPKKETPFVESSFLDPYNQNLLKADYPIKGNHTFLNLNLQSVSTLNPRTVAVGGKRDQFFTNQNLVIGAEIFKGDTVFQPKTFAVRVTSVVNFNLLANNTLNPFESKRGKARITLEEAFVEKRVAVLSPNFDFVSVRVGMQNFTSDFRGFLFTDNQLGARVFGNAKSNRDQYNVAFFSMRQRDEVSQLHTFDRRHQNVFIANWFHQDFLTKGYTAMVNFHFNSDHGLQPGDRASLNVAYFGVHGDGHWGNWSVNHAFYQAFGHDTRNRLTSRSESINAQMAALEVSRDRDWIRYRSSFFYASGDGNLNDGKAHGFDMITDNPNFAGGQFMFWTQQATVLGAGRGTLTNKFSLLANLRNKFTQRSNFVNPGLLVFNGGADFKITPKLKAVTNFSYVRFAQSLALRQLTGDNRIANGIGADLSVAAKFRPFLNENMTIVVGGSMLLPEGGYARLINSRRPLVSPTVAIQFAF